MEKKNTNQGSYFFIDYFWWTGADSPSLRLGHRGCSAHSQPFSSAEASTGYFFLSKIYFIHFGPERTRTAYLLVANEAFYQMNYRPMVGDTGIEPVTFTMSM